MVGVNLWLCSWYLCPPRRSSPVCNAMFESNNLCKTRPAAKADCVRRNQKESRPRRAVGYHSSSSLLQCVCVGMKMVPRKQKKRK